MNKPKRLRSATRNVQLRSDMAKSGPQLFIQVVGDAWPGKLDAVVSDLAGGIETQNDGRD